MRYITWISNCLRIPKREQPDGISSLLSLVPPLLLPSRGLGLQASCAEEEAAEHPGHREARVAPWAFGTLKDGLNGRGYLRGVMEYGRKYVGRRAGVICEGIVPY